MTTQSEFTKQILFQPVVVFCPNDLLLQNSSFLSGPTHNMHFRLEISQSKHLLTSNNAWLLQGSNFNFAFSSCAHFSESFFSPCSLFPSLFNFPRTRVCSTRSHRHRTYCLSDHLFLPQSF